MTYDVSEVVVVVLVPVDLRVDDGPGQVEALANVGQEVALEQGLGRGARDGGGGRLAEWAVRAERAQAPGNKGQSGQMT